MKNGKNRICGIISIALAALNGLGLLGFSSGLILHRRTFMEMFSDLALALPLVTRLVLILPTGLIVMSTLVLLVLLVAKEFIGQKVIPLVLNIVWMFVALGISLLVTWALMAPMSTAIGDM